MGSSAYGGVLDGDKLNSIGPGRNGDSGPWQLLQARMIVDSGVGAAEIGVKDSWRERVNVLTLTMGLPLKR